MTGLRPEAGELHARRLEIVTILWNAVEMAVTIMLGVAAGSLALIAFGLDSVAEILASAAVLWSLRSDVARGRERFSLRLVAGAFFLLATVLAAGSIYNLATGHRPDSSLPGMLYLAVAATVMYGLARSKRRAALGVDNHPLVHEARVTYLDAILAVGVLLALLMNAALGWWWADSAAALLVAAMAVIEGAMAPIAHQSNDPSSV
jgi:divalent metal cation (Fe/Co/Zn/Cd) transporter